MIEPIEKCQVCGNFLVISKMLCFSFAYPFTYKIKAEKPEPGKELVCGLRYVCRRCAESITVALEDELRAKNEVV